MSVKNPESTRVDFSPYKRCVLTSFVPHASGSERESTEQSQSRATNTQPTIKINTNHINSQDGQKFPEKVKRHRYIPSSFSMSMSTLIKPSSRPETASEDCKNLSNKSIQLVKTEIPTPPPAKSSVKSDAQTKGAIGRFLESAKRSFTIDSNKPIQSTRGSMAKTRHRRKDAFKLTISYPMKLQHSDFSYIASQDPWAYHPKPNGTPLRRYATSVSNGRPSRPLRTDSRIQRSLTSRRPRLPVHHSSKSALAVTSGPIIRPPHSLPQIPRVSKSASVSSPQSSQLEILDNHMASYRSESNLNRTLNQSTKPTTSPEKRSITRKRIDTVPTSILKGPKSAKKNPSIFSLPSYRPNVPREDNLPKSPTIHTHFDAIEEDITLTLMGSPQGDLPKNKNVTSPSKEVCWEDTRVTFISEAVQDDLKLTCTSDPIQEDNKVHGAEDGHQVDLNTPDRTGTSEDDVSATCVGCATEVDQHDIIEAFQSKKIKDEITVTVSERSSEEVQKDINQNPKNSLSIRSDDDIFTTHIQSDSFFDTPNSLKDQLTLSFPSSPNPINKSLPCSVPSTPNPINIRLPMSLPSSPIPSTSSLPHIFKKSTPSSMTSIRIDELPPQSPPNSILTYESRLPTFRHLALGPLDCGIDSTAHRRDRSTWYDEMMSSIDLTISKGQ